MATTPLRPLTQSAHTDVVLRSDASSCLYLRLIDCACNQRIGDGSYEPMAFRPKAALKQHDCADSKRARKADQQPSDMLVVPDPATLKIGKLDAALSDLRKDLVEQAPCAVECTPRSRR